MKKFLALLLAAVMMLALVSCFSGEKPDNNDDGKQDPPAGEVTTMTYEEYIEAEDDTEVVVDVYVQATQSWWDNKITVYAADEDGAYFIYEMACPEADAAKLVPGAKIRVTGFKTTWAGEVEIMDASFELLEGDPYIAEAVDLTEYLGTDSLIDYQNFLGRFKGVTIENIEFKNDEPGDDIYVTIGYNEQSFNFCVERYLTGPETEVYQFVSGLKVGEVVDIEGFVYWYEDAVNTHITSVSYPKPMTYAEYVNADINSAVDVEVYVQATQSWYNNKITVYAADKDGAYFLYNMACPEEDAAKLVPGAKIRVKGYKAEWSGEVEIMDATFEFVEGDSYIAPIKDVTNLLGTNDIINYQNQYVCFTGVTIEGIEFKNGSSGDDIYVTVSYNGATYDFCVERYLTGPETEVYQDVSALQVGDVVIIEGYLYWYNGVNTHITAVKDI